MRHAHIYNELVRYYNRSLRKFQRLALEGKNLQKQYILRRRILRLFETLMGLRRTLRLGMATSALSAGVLLFQPKASQAQISFAPVQTNPFNLVDIGFYPVPSIPDLDNDGDLDLMSGESNGSFKYFKNTGTASAPSFAAKQTNPFGLTDIGFQSSCAFVDLDNDGDWDLMAGEESGKFEYFQNTGTASAPTFAAAQINPFGLTDIGGYSTPAFADLDNDGDLDLMAGNSDGNFKYFQNTGIASAPSFTTLLTNPFGLSDIGFWSAPSFDDLDHDGDMDLMAGEEYGNFVYFQNTGTATTPAFAAGLTNSFGLTDIGTYSAPAFADLDHDGDMDLMAGEGFGDFKYFENTTVCDMHLVYADVDGDGYGDLANSFITVDCIVPGGYVTNNSDCNDANSSINPAASEICANTTDDNCNGQTDENCIGCELPASLSVNSITPTSANLKWSEVTTAEGYKLRYKLAGTTDWNYRVTSAFHKKILDLTPATEYAWGIKTYCTISPNVMSEWSATQFFTTSAERLSSNQQTTFDIYPNPFSDHTVISYSPEKSSHITIELFDMAGRKLQTLFNETVEAGSYEVNLDRQQLPAGMYVLKMKNLTSVATRSIIIQ